MLHSTLPPAAEHSQDDFFISTLDAMVAVVETSLRAGTTEATELGRTLDEYA
jgi:hypothetical protein